MTQVWTKLSRTATFDRGKWTGTQNYRIFDDANASLTIAALATTGASHEVFGDGDETTMATYLRFVSATYTPDADGSDKHWLASYQFESITGSVGTTTTSDVKTETEVGFTSIETSIQAQAIDVWRTGATLPSSPYSTPSDTTDIGGTKVDSAGEPVSQIQSMMTVHIRNVILGRPPYATYSLLVGKRNSGSFVFGSTGNTFTCVTGALLFEGATTSRIGPNQYEVNFQFSYDPVTFHLRQVPLRDTEGVVIEPTTTGTAVSVSNPMHAKSVFYRQPFPGTDNFSGLAVVST